MSKVRRGIAVAVLWLLAASGAAAQSEQYAACLEEAQTNPEAGRETAAQWEALGGGAEARHCGAVALIGLGAEGRAAQILTEIGSEDAGAPVPDRVSALVLAGDLWLRQRRPDLAARTYAVASKLDETARAARIGSAQAAAAQGDWAGAIAALEPLTAAGPDPEALTLRAAAKRAAGDAEGALADATSAAELAPDAALAWFEKGAAERALERIDDARESWIVASRLDPTGDAGELARINLQKLAPETQN